MRAEDPAEKVCALTTTLDAGLSSRQLSSMNCRFRTTQGSTGGEYGIPSQVTQGNTPIMDSRT
jgi:hypothetical protein